MLIYMRRFSNFNIYETEISPTLEAVLGNGGGNIPTVLSCKTYGWDAGANRDMGVAFYEECSKTVANGSCPGHHNDIIKIGDDKMKTIVRRLTPLECERLQGFPDNWTNIGDWTDSKGKIHKAADSPRYKALGNSLALPQWYWIVQKMKPFIGDGATLGSLFDGIGGFPLVWEETYGKGTAIWASEIEEFPIAVTKIHFPETQEK